MKQKKYKYKPTKEERDLLLDEKRVELEMCIRTCKESMDKYVEEYKSLSDDTFSEVERIVDEGSEGYDDIDEPEFDSDKLW